MIMDTKESRYWPGLGRVCPPHEFRLKGLSREGAIGKWLSGCNEFTRSETLVAQLGMESPFREISNSLYREARRTAEDRGTEQTAGGKDVGHGEVRAQDPGERGDLIERSDSDSADDEAQGE
jgi:hypothetical protein